MNDTVLFEELKESGITVAADTAAIISAAKEESQELRPPIIDDS